MTQTTTAPRTSRAAVAAIVEALAEVGITPQAVEATQVRTVKAATGEICGRSDARYYVTLPDGARSMVVFVPSNGDVVDVVADWGLALDSVIGPIIDGWW